jgi:hypothetical protein
LLSFILCSMVPAMKCFDVHDIETSTFTNTASTSFTLV